MTDSFRVDIPADLQPYISAATVRLGYLHPEVSFTLDDKSVHVKLESEIGSGETQRLSKEVMYQVYREKIYSETLSIRRWLYSHDE